MIHTTKLSRVCRKGKEMFYLLTHSTHFVYGYMASDIWLRTILIVRKETCCHHMGCSFRLTARVLLYTPSHRQDSTYHSLCYISRGVFAGVPNSFITSLQLMVKYTADMQLNWVQFPSVNPWSLSPNHTSYTDIIIDKNMLRVSSTTTTGYYNFYY